MLVETDSKSSTNQQPILKSSSYLELLSNEVKLSQIG